MEGEKKKWRRKRRERKFKNQTQKNWKLVGNPKSHTSGALTPPAITCHVATMCTVPPLHINAPPLCVKHGTKPQESCLGKQPSTFWWSSWHTMMTTEPGGQLMGSMNSLAQMTSSNTSVYLATAWTRKSKPLMRSFNASDRYQLAVKPLVALQNPY